MTRIEVSAEEVAGLAAPLHDVVGQLGDASALGGHAEWLGGGPMLDALEEVLTTWERRRLALEQSVGDLAQAARVAGALYLEAEGATVDSLGFAAGAGDP